MFLPLRIRGRWLTFEFFLKVRVEINPKWCDRKAELSHAFLKDQAFEAALAQKLSLGGLFLRDRATSDTKRH